MWVKQLKPYFRVLIAIVMLALLYRSGLLQIDKIRDALYNKTILISGFILFGLQILMFAVRFKLVTSLLQKITFTAALKLQLIGQFFNTFIPGGVGGDVVKAIELSSTLDSPRRNALAITLVDRVMGLYGLILFSFFFLMIELDVLKPAHQKYFKASLLLFVLANVGFLLRKQFLRFFTIVTKKITEGFSFRLKDSLIIFFDYLNSIINSMKFFYFLLVSSIAQFFSITFLYIVVTQVSGDSISYSLFFPLACFGFVAMAIPITPGGIGFGQAAFYFIFKSVGDPVAEAAIVGISMMQLFNIFYSLPGSYYFIRRGSQASKTVDI